MTNEEHRALDAWLAEHLLGWEVKTHRVLDMRHSERPDWIGGFKTKAEGRAWIGAVAPRYSFTWEGMGLVVEGMREKGWYLHTLDHSWSQMRRAAFWPPEPEPVEVPSVRYAAWCFAPTLPLAVALAAKKALEEKA